MTRLAILTLLACALAACAGPGLDARTTAALSRLTYPKDAPLGPDLDMVVRPSRTHVRLSNRTPRTYNHVQLWLNQQYVRPLRRLAIGGEDANRFSLNEFINRRGDHYPVAGLLTPDKGSPLVLAEIFDPATGLRHRLVVQLH